jgi:hypothetical protein
MFYTSASYICFIQVFYTVVLDIWLMRHLSILPLLACPRKSWAGVIGRSRLKQIWEHHIREIGGHPFDGVYPERKPNGLRTTP